MFENLRKNRTVGDATKLLLDNNTQIDGQKMMQVTAFCVSMHLLHEWTWNKASFNEPQSAIMQAYTCHFISMTDKDPFLDSNVEDIVPQVINVILVTQLYVQRVHNCTRRRVFNTQSVTCHDYMHENFTASLFMDCHRRNCTEQSLGWASCYVDDTKLCDAWANLQHSTHASFYTMSSNIVAMMNKCLFFDYSLKIWQHYVHEKSALLCW
jgi:hypothetical protein